MLDPITKAFIRDLLAPLHPEDREEALSNITALKCYWRAAATALTPEGRDMLRCAISGVVGDGETAEQAEDRRRKRRAVLAVEALLAKLVVPGAKLIGWGIYLHGGAAIFIRRDGRLDCVREDGWECEKDKNGRSVPLGIAYRITATLDLDKPTDLDRLVAYLKECDENRVHRTL